MRNGENRAWLLVLAAAQTWLAVAALAPRAAAAAASSWQSNPQSAVRLVTADVVAPRRGELRLGVQFRLSPHWHVYWKNSGDAGYAPVVAFARQDGMSYPEALWPAPRRFDLAGGLVAFGYADAVVYPFGAQLSNTAAATLHIAADVDYLVCEVDCVPHRYTLTLDQATGDREQPDPETGPLLDQAWREIPIPAGGLPGVTVSGAIVGVTGATGATGAAGSAAHAAAGAGGAAGATAGEAAPMVLTLRLDGLTASPQGADLFFEVHPDFDLGRPRLQAGDGGQLRAAVFVVPVSRKDSSAPLAASTSLVWTATGLSRARSDGDGAPAALTGRLQVPVSAVAPRAATPAAMLEAGPQAAVPGRRPQAAGGAASWRDRLSAFDPVWPAAGAALAALLTLDLWGLLRRRLSPDRGAPQREALGFAAFLAVLGLLYVLSLTESPEGLALTELALLGTGLAAWLRSSRRSAAARGLLAAVLIGCVLAAPWLSRRNRLQYSRAGAALSPHAAQLRPASPRHRPHDLDLQGDRHA